MAINTKFTGGPELAIGQYFGDWLDLVYELYIESNDECWYERMLLRNYVRQLAIPRPTAKHVYYKDGLVYAIRFDCGNEYLYIRAFDSYLHGFEIWHSDEALNMEECDGCPDACEKQLEFKQIYLLDC